MTFQKDLLPQPVSYFAGRGVKLTGNGKWRTGPCEFHGSSATLRVNTETGGWVCMSCGVKGGDVIAYEMACTNDDFVTVVKYLGAWVASGKPHAAYKPAPLPARDALEVLAFEALLVSVAASNVARGVTLTYADRERLLTASSRISVLKEAYR